MSKRKTKEALNNENQKKIRIETKIRPTKRSPATEPPEDHLITEYFKQIKETISQKELDANEYKEIIGSVIAKPGLTSRHSDLLIDLFKHLLNQKSLTETIYLSLIELFDESFLSKYKELSTFLILVLFDLEKPSAKKFKFDYSCYFDLIKQSCRLLENCVSKRDLILQKIFYLFINLNYKSKLYLKDKHVYLKSEKYLIEKLSSLLKSSQEQNLSSDILKVFKTIINEESINLINNNFVFILYISLINNFNDSDKKAFNDSYLSLFQTFFNYLILTSKSECINKCLNKRLSYKNLLNMFNFNYLQQYINQTKLVENLVYFSKIVLDLHGLEISQFMNQPKTIGEYFSHVAYKIFEEVFRKSRLGRETVLSELLNKAFDSSNKAVYISILDILLNTDLTLKSIFGSGQQEEKDVLNKLIIQKLCSFTIVKQSPKSSLTIQKFSLFELEPQLSLKLLKCFKIFFYTSKKNDKTNFDQLFNIFKLNLNNECLNKKKLSIYSLMLFLIELNRDHFGHFKCIDRNDLSLSRDSCLQQNIKYSLEIIDLIQKQFNQDQLLDIEIKSHLYQSFYNVLKTTRSSKKTTNSLNDRLIEPCAWLFRTQLDKYLIRDQAQDLVYFNLDKCVSLDEFKLSEPIDILLHCAALYASTGLKQVSSIHPSYRTLSSIQLVMTQLKKTYLNKDSKYLFDLYKQQLINKVKYQESPASCMKIIHQIQLGFLDVLVENSVNNEYFDDIIKILEKYDSISSQISLEIENLMSSYKTESMKKRKLITESIGSNKSKKLSKSIKNDKRLESDSDKENQPRTSKTNRLAESKYKRETLADIGNKKQALEQQPEQDLEVNKTSLSVLQNLSFANIQFEHEHRISFKCCLKMIKLYLGSYETDIFKSNQIKQNQNLLNSILSLISNEKFIDFVIKVVEKKLKALVSNPDIIYDPQSKNAYQIFDFLSGLWLSFCQRLNGSISDEKSVFKSDISQRFGPSFLGKTYRFIQCCQSIWHMVSTRFQSYKQKLVKVERRYYCINEFETIYSVEDDDQKMSVIYWKFLKNCARTLKNHLNPSPINSSISNKCCLGFLNLMFDITKSVYLTRENYHDFSKFLFELADHNIAEDQEIGKMLIKILCYIASKTHSPIYVIKYLALDYSNYVYLCQENTDESRDPIDEISLQFRLFQSKTNLAQYLQIINEQIFDSFDLFTCCFSSNKILNQNSCLISIMKQIESLVLILSYIFRSVSSFETAELNLRLMIKFYDFLTKFFVSDLIKNLTHDGLGLIKDLIDKISSQLQSKMSHELNRINDFIVCDEQQKEEKENGKQILNIIKYKELMVNLITSIDKFEHEMLSFSNSVKDTINLIQNYSIFIASLQLNFSSKIIRTVSEHEINDILSHKSDF